MPKVDSLKQANPDFSFERGFIERSCTPVAGIDEAGRGPWAGPVVAAAVILDPRNIPEGLNDSKKLSPVRRDALFKAVVEEADVGIGIADVDIIDRDNILSATMQAMAMAFRNLPVKAEAALIDGNRTPELPCKCETLVKGDSRSLSIAAASIVAKVTRDRMMLEIDAEFPAYGFARHKGYGTREHQQALSNHGICRHHRRSFAPIKACL